MGDWDIRGSSFSVPPFAGPDEPAWVVGDDIPASLTTYYAGFGAQTVVAAQIFRLNSTVYNWIALVTQAGVPSLSWGTANATGIDEVMTMYRNGLQPTIIIGSGRNSVIAIETGSGFSIRTGADWVIDTFSQPRGLRARVTDVSVTPDIGAETVLFTTAAAIDFVAGRAYRVDWQGPLITSAANQTTMRVRRGTLVTGALKAEWNIPVASSGVVQQASGYAYIRNNGAATITTRIVLTMAATLGISRFQTSTTSVATFEVSDIGSSNDYLNAIII